jgi:putative transposase
MLKDSYTKYKIIQPFLDESSSLKSVSISQDIPLRTLQRWCKLYKEQGFPGLEQQQRSDKGKYRHVSQKLLHFIEGLALKRPKLSIAAICDKANELAKILNAPNISYNTVTKIINNLPKSMIVLAQEGDKVYEETFDLLYKHEAKSSNETWQADHTLLDIYLIDISGKQVRPWLTIIIDDYSRAIAGYYLFLDAPSALQTALAFRQAIWTKNEAEWQICGIPERLYTDHGSDFTSKHIEMVCADLKIQLIFSNVGKPRGRGKIERFFNTVNQKLLCRLPGYITKNYQIDTKSLLTLAQFEIQLKTFLLKHYNQESHSETKEPPIDRWSSKGFLPQLPESLEKLDLLLLAVAKPRKVHQDGIYFQNLRYIDPVLAAYVGESIVIRYDPRDVAEIRVFYQNKFLCRAICQELAGEVISLKDITRARNQRKKELKEVIAKRRSLVDQLLNNQSTVTDESNSPTTERAIVITKVKKLKLYDND